MPELQEEAMSIALAKSAQHISDSLADCLPPISGVNERTNVFDMTTTELCTLNFDQLVDLRFAHQTKQAASGTRKSVKGASKAQIVGHAVEKSGTASETQRQALLRKLNEVIKEQQERGVSKSEASAQVQSEDCDGGTLHPVAEMGQWPVPFTLKRLQVMPRML
jgi:hypothetical protein